MESLTFGAFKTLAFILLHQLKVKFLSWQSLAAKGLKRSYC
ncbi:hypothetical protein STRMA_1326 [Streptococcus macacae NCTC 11558]|uniref:Uncharacterized protein n=1 Tax=Streptococcus macacae NCTC 11558 TaxID=764298 RepID=G5JXH0_9STRE|nr:hypothetical protein STRMA_1326 [Streptococcus macacae NCTC 11558]